jgi:hypothetical protein
MAAQSVISRRHLQWYVWLKPRCLIWRGDAAHQTLETGPWVGFENNAG